MAVALQASVVACAICITLGFKPMLLDVETAVHDSGSSLGPLKHLGRGEARAEGTGRPLAPHRVLHGTGSGQVEM